MTETRAATARVGRPEDGAEPEIELLDWNPALVESLHDLLDAVGMTSPALFDGIASLTSRYHDLVYSELIYLLSNLRFEPEEARHHWERILAHRERTHGPDGEPVDVRVALVSYFLEVSRKLRNPKIIEMKLFERTRDSAYRDELTGLHNYRMLREYLEQEVLRSDRDAAPLSLVMIDLDDFKLYNDTHGHEAGNEVLVEFAAALRDVLRRSDIAARYGGEEFGLILPSTSKTAAAAVAERAREAARQLTGRRLTASLGVSTYPADAANAAELVRHADRAMYVAKTRGKDQVQLYGKSRRSFGRVDAALRGEFRMLSPGKFPLTTVNVSEAGLLISTPRSVEVGALIDFRIRMPSREEPLRGTGRVVHSDPGPSGLHHAALRIGELADGDRAILTEYVRSLSRRDEADRG